MVLAGLIAWMDNPASRIDFSSDPTISRNKGKANVEVAPAVDLKPIETAIPALEAPKGTEEGE